MIARFFAQLRDPAIGGSDDLDLELDRLGDMITHRRGVANDYAGRGIGWAEVPADEVCPDLRMKVDVALLDASVDLWIPPPQIRWFGEATASDEVVFRAPPLWGSFRDGEIWLNDAVRDVVAVVSHEVWHAAHAGAEELIAGAEERAAQEYGEAASARWHSQ